VAGHDKQVLQAVVTVRIEVQLPICGQREAEGADQPQHFRLAPGFEEAARQSATTASLDFTAA
jgi:hypothetical protein